MCSSSKCNFRTNLACRLLFLRLCMTYAREGAFSHAWPEEERLGATQTWEAFALCLKHLLCVREFWSGQRAAKMRSGGLCQVTENAWRKWIFFCDQMLFKVSFYLHILIMHNNRLHYGISFVYILVLFHLFPTLLLQFSLTFFHVFLFLVT